MKDKDKAKEKFLDGVKYIELIIMAINDVVKTHLKGAGPSMQGFCYENVCVYLLSHIVAILKDRGNSDQDIYDVFTRIGKDALKFQEQAQEKQSYEIVS